MNNDLKDWGGLAPDLSPRVRSSSDQSRLNALAGLIKQKDTLRYIDYRQAEYDCELLAANMRQVYPGRELESFSFTAIHRGGLIVLGMLSYILNLLPDQLETNLASSNPLVIVDDCALSGARFGDFLSKTKSQYVVFAHLYSNPELRSAILGKEPRVKECLAAHDLMDNAPIFRPDPVEYQAWRGQWLKRFGSERYWIGQPDLVCFAWSEPDRAFWNDATQHLEVGWHFVPPQCCLKNKSALGLPPKAITDRKWQMPSSVATGSFDGVWWLCQTAQGKVYTLQDVAADMWRALAVYGEINAAAEYLLSHYEIEEVTLRNDLNRFANDLLGEGLLEKANGSSPDRT